MAVLLVESPRIKTTFIGGDEFNFAIRAILGLLHDIDSRTRIGHILVRQYDGLSLAQVTSLMATMQYIEACQKLVRHDQGGLLSPDDWTSFKR